MGQNEVKPGQFEVSEGHLRGSQGHLAFDCRRRPAVKETPNI